MEKTTDKALFVSFLLDETGSMQSIKDDTIGGFNAYLEELQKGDGETVFSLVSFNSSETTKRYVAEPVKDVKPLTDGDYRPQAMTPLIDASSSPASRSTATRAASRAPISCARQPLTRWAWAALGWPS